MRSAYSFIALVAAALLVGSLVGCDRGDGAIPDSADGRMKDTTQALPADTQMAFVLSDLAHFRKSAKDAQKTLDRVFPVETLLDRVQASGPAEDFIGDEGVKIFKKKFWKDIGVAPDSAFTLGIVDYNAVGVTYVADKKKFEKEFTEENDAKPQKFKVAGSEAKSLESDDGTIVWAYQGKRATVVLPSKEIAEDAGEQPVETKKTLERILKTKEDGSLASSSAFQKYSEAAGDRPTLAFFRLEPFVDESELQGNSKYAQKFQKSFTESLDGAGLVLDTETNRVQARMWFGLTDQGKKNVDSMFTSPVQGDWSKYATDQTLIALRSAGNLKSFWNSVESTMSEEDKKQFEQNLKMANEATGLDIRKDVLENLNGQSGLFIYGIGGEATPELFGNPMKALTKLRALYAMKFGDAETLTTLSKKAEELGDKYVDRRPLELKDGQKKVDAIQVLDLKMPAGGLVGMMGGGMPGAAEKGEPKMAPIRFFVHEDSLLLASSTISEAQIHQFLTGKGGDAKPLTEVEKLDLGAKFAQDEQLSGFYVNFERFRSIFGNLVKNVPMASVKKAANTLEELLLATDLQENGLFVDLSVDLLPDGDGSKEGGE